ncbi:MAG: site-specific integrase [Muribaculaceae bacterium]|nr:site-specific integrase [Muribaculaceae bacterium]
MRDSSDTKRIIRDYNAYMALERGFSDNTICAYDDDINKFMSYMS